ncbi:MAG: hypothetical protein J6C10_06575 [Prevotella sp.]|nr:hypothetical protein [Prevotella sp.]
MDELVERLIEEMDSDDWFTTNLRVYMIWDDSKYIKMINLIKAIISKYQQNYLIPKILIYFFSFEVDIICSICKNKLFFDIISDIIGNKIEYKKLVEERIMELEDMKKNFFLGESNLDLRKPW